MTESIPGKQMNRVSLLQILRITLEDKPHHHIIHDPLDRRVVVGEYLGRFVASFEIGECHLRGVNQQRGFKIVLVSE